MKMDAKLSPSKILGRNTIKWLLGHPLGSFFGKDLVFGLALGLGFGTHDSTTPLLPVLIVLVIEVSLKTQKESRKWIALYICKIIILKICNSTHLDSFQDSAELQLVFILDCGQAQNWCSLLVDNLSQRLKTSVWNPQLYFHNKILNCKGTGTLTAPNRDFPFTMQYGISIFLHNAGSHTTNSMGSTSWAITTNWAFFCKK